MQLEVLDSLKVRFIAGLVSGGGINWSFFGEPQSGVFFGKSQETGYN